MIIKDMSNFYYHPQPDYYKRVTNATRSLDLLRKNIQSAFNKEVDNIVKTYIDKFFRPAIQNIRSNLGDESLHEDSLRVVCSKMLDEAKSQYCTINKINSQQQHYQTETPSSSDIVGTKMVKRKPSVFRTVTSIIPGPGGSTTPIKIVKLEAVRREGPKWDPARIQQHTLFIMGARANKVLGFGQTRGRLYTKHPELLKYSGDAEDKEWLSRNNLMPPTGGTAYLLLLEDVRELAMSEEYRYNPNVLLHELKGFQAPNFMLTKIQMFIAHARTDQHVNYNINYKPETARNEIQCQPTFNEKTLSLTDLIPVSSQPKLY